MSIPLRHAYELGSERIIASRYSGINEKEQSDFKMDFVPIPEFMDREDKVLDSNESHLIIDSDKEGSDSMSNVSDIKIQEPQHITIADKPMEVVWSGPFYGHAGYDRMNRNFVFGLSNRNVVVKTEIENHLIHINKATQDQLIAMSQYEVSSSSPRVFGVTVPTRFSYPCRKILYTMMESSEKAHPDYIGKLNMMDEIWVPSKYGKNVLERSNIHPPVHVMPLGVDINRYRPGCEKMDFGSMRKFVFLSVFRWSYRKGFDILLKAYMEEFSGNEDVSLLMVSRSVECPEENGSNKIMKDFSSIRQCVKKTDNELPHVALYGSNPIHEKDMPKVYGSCNAFVLISRGEGFGLPYIEAAACGLPVIASNVTAQRDFLTPTNSYLVEPEGYVEAKINGNLSNMAKLCRFYENQPFPNFGRKAIEQTRAHLRYVYEHQKEAKEKAKILRNLVINNYTWDMAVDRVYNRLAEIEED